jgi:type I restriction enzyme S subunit
MSEWKETTLGELISVKHGWAFKSEFFDDTSYKKNNIVVAIGNFNYEGGFRFDSTKTKQYFGDYPKDYELDPGDILLAMTCQTAGGEILGIPGKIPNDGNLYLHNQRLGKVEIKNKDLLDPSFIYWLFIWKPFNYHLTVTATGTKILHTSPSRIEEFTFKCPPIKTQKEIGKILDCLDNKIDNLRRQNETLEKIAQTLFKHWFIDFEFPNDDGKPYKSSGGAIVASELGDIPEGWTTKPLDEIADFLNGLALQKYPPENENNFLPVIKIRELRTGVTDGTDRASTNIPEKYIIDNGDIIFSWSGSLDVVIWNFGKGALNQHLFKVNSHNYPKWLYYYWTLNHLQSFQHIAKSKATTMGHIQRKHLTEALCNVPNDNFLEKASEVFSPILQKIINNAQQIQTLTKTRDALLPKLMSGQLRVKD